MEWYERTDSIRRAGVLATACKQRGPYATREVPAVIAVRINWQLVRDRRADWDGGEARSTDEAGALDYPEAAYERHKTNAATQNFETQLAKAKHGSFNTKGQVFAVIQGKLSTEPQWKDNIGSPGTFLIEVVICSTDIAMETTTPEEAVSQCRREGKSK